MATLNLQDSILFKYNAYPVTLTLSSEYIASHFVGTANVNDYIYNQLTNMHTCAVTNGGYTLVTCRACCKPSKKERAKKMSSILSSSETLQQPSFADCTTSFYTTQEYPSVVNVVKAENAPQKLSDGSFVFTVNVKPICTSSRNHLHTNVFLVLCLFGEVYSTRSFMLRARKFQSQARKLRETQPEGGVSAKKRGRPSNKKNELEQPAEKYGLMDTGMGYIQHESITEESGSSDEGKSTECPNSPSGSETEYNAPESPEPLQLCSGAGCDAHSDDQLGALSSPDWARQEQTCTNTSYRESEYTWLSEPADSLLGRSFWESGINGSEFFETGHWLWTAHDDESCCWIRGNAFFVPCFHLRIYCHDNFGGFFNSEFGV